MAKATRFGVALLITGILAVAVTVTADSRNQNVRLRDDCDPATFDAAVGPGTCVGNGDTTFDRFIADLTKDQFAGAWRFNPDDVDVAKTTNINAVNEGGETHTFTEVASFGGGFIPLLNDLSGNPVPATECVTDAKVGPTFVPAGGRLTKGALSVGEHKFQCCIHPWMRTVVTVRNKN